MRLRHIEVFHAIYTTGSITAAAKQLYVSQPSVSKVLAHAEMQLGFALFHRNKGQLAPTAEAEVLFLEADKIYRQLQSIRKLSDNIQNNDFGCINLAFSPALGFSVIPKAVAAFRKHHPNIHFNLLTTHNDQAIQALNEYKCDIAIQYASSSAPGITREAFAQSEIVILYPLAMFPDQPGTLGCTELAGHELIGIWESGPMGQLAKERLQNDGMNVRSALQVDSYYVAARMVAEGLGCCCIDKNTALGNLLPGVGMASFSPALTFAVNALYLESKPLSKLCQEFMGYLQKTLLENADNPALSAT